MSTLPANTADMGHEDTLEDVIARIKARGRGSMPPKPSAEVIARIAAIVATEQPLSAEEQAAWDREWLHVVDDMRARDRANDIAEGRG